MHPTPDGHAVASGLGQLRGRPSVRDRASPGTRLPVGLPWDGLGGSSARGLRARPGPQFAGRLRKLRTAHEFVGIWTLPFVNSLVLCFPDFILTCLTDL